MSVESHQLGQLADEFGEVVGVQKGEQVVLDAVSEVGIDDKTTYSPDDIIQICTVIENEESGVVAGVAREIRSRKETERRFDQLFSTIPDPGLVVQSQYGGPIVRNMNDAAERILDVDPAADGEPLLADVLASTEGEDVTGLVQQQLAAEERARAELSVRVDGELRHYIARVSPVSGAAAADQAILLFTDITEQKRQQRRLERLQEVTSVLNRILRHNLRNDMNVIIGLTEMLEPADGIEEQEEGISPVSSIRSTAEELLEIAENGRRVRRAIRGASRGEVDAVAVVREQTEAIASQHPAATVDVQAPDEAWVVADEQLDTVVAHLLENAIEHNDRPEPAVTVVVERSSDDAVVTIAVTDDGPGIPESEIEAIERGDETPLQHGSGVGLWLVNWLVGRYGGELDIERLSPRGTRVTATLPVAERGDDHEE